MKINKFNLLIAFWLLLIFHYVAYDGKFFSILININFKFSLNASHLRVNNTTKDYGYRLSLFKTFS